MSCLRCGDRTDVGAGYGPCEGCQKTELDKTRTLFAGAPPPVFVAWTVNLLPDTNPRDRINLIVERTKEHASMSLHCEIEESGPEVGKPATIVVVHPVVRYVPETVVDVVVAEARREERERVIALLTAERERVRGKTSDGYLWALDWFEEAVKGKSK